MSDASPAKGFQLSNSLYNNLKFLVQIVMPALGVLYVSLASFWGFPKVEEVVGTITALTLFLGVVLRISSSNYNAPSPEPAEVSPDGAFAVTTLPDGRKSVKLEFEQDPNSLIDGRVLSLVVREDPLPETPEVEEEP